MQELEILLEKIVNQFGIEVINEPRCISIIKDLNQNIPPAYINSLNYFINQGIVKKIYLINQSTSVDCNFKINNLKQKILNENFLTPQQIEILDFIFEINLKKDINTFIEESKKK